MKRRLLCVLSSVVAGIAGVAGAIPGSIAKADPPPASAPSPAAGAASAPAPSSSAPANGAAGPAGSAPAPAAAPPAEPAPEAEKVAPPDTDQRMDLGIERLKAGKFTAAAGVLYGVYSKLPTSDSRRELASYHLATALEKTGLTQAAVEHYLEILSDRRAPELMDKVLAELKILYENRLVSERRFVEDVLFGGQYTDLTPDVADFVEYLQALTDVRHGFATWGRARLETLAKANRPYSFSARYLLAVERIALKDDDNAAKELKFLTTTQDQLPLELRNKARTALGRIFYEKKSFDEAWQTYSQVDSPLPLQDNVMIERAWDRVASGNQQRALGLLVGLGAPVFRNIFAPERSVIRGIALRRLCQYRAAHLAVRDFRNTYGAVIDAVRKGAVRDQPSIRSWALASTEVLRDQVHIGEVLAREEAALGSIGDKALREHLKLIYSTGTATVKEATDRELEHATEKVAEELLRIDEQMSLLDYEIGAGLFKPSGEGTAAPSVVQVPYGSDAVYFRFDGEYWSDELRDYVVLAEDRCLR
jgi:tetratricopeptide (TPR) repeat protein